MNTQNVLLIAATHPMLKTSRIDRPATTDWPARQRYWQRKLRRFRLSAEPVEEQLARYRRVTWMLTAVPLGLGLMFLALFSAFRRPDVGLLLGGILFAPLIAIAWLDYAVLASRTARYRRERDPNSANPPSV